MVKTHPCDTSPGGEQTNQTITVELRRVDASEHRTVQRRRRRRRRQQHATESNCKNGTCRVWVARGGGGRTVDGGRDWRSRTASGTHRWVGDAGDVERGRNGAKRSDAGDARRWSTSTRRRVAAATAGRRQTQRGTSVRSWPAAARLHLARLGSFWLGSFQLGSVWLGSARISLARLGSI